MISRLFGTHDGMDPDGGIVVAVGGVGYRVLVSDRDRALINMRGRGSEVSLWCRTFASENEITIYGFTDIEDRETFGKLLKVNGVGASTALRLLSVFAATGIKVMVSTRDIGSFTTVPGIGKKTAEKICTEARL